MSYIILKLVGGPFDGELIETSDQNTDFKVYSEDGTQFAWYHWGDENPTIKQQEAYWIDDPVTVGPYDHQYPNYSIVKDEP